MAQGTNFEYTRAYNRRAVLQALRIRGNASRTEIAQHTQLSLQAVSNIIGELVEEDLVLQGGRRSTARGQPPIDFSLNPSGAYSIGFSLDQNSLQGLLINLAGEIVNRQTLEVAQPEPAEAFAHLQTLTHAFTAALPTAHRKRLYGVGLALPGVIDADGGRVRKMVRLPAWEGIRVGDTLTNLLERPVYVANDAISAAIGELWYGHGRNAKSFFYIIYALGLGSSLILDGAPYRGLWGVTGRMGHIPVEPNGKTCPACGETGCLSLYTSLEALYSTLAEHGVHAKTPDDLERLYHLQNSQLLEWLERAAHYLTRGIVVLENLLDPDAFIFGGILPRVLLEHLTCGIRDRYEHRPVRLRKQAPQFLLARYGADATPFGAATLPIYLMIAPNYDLVLSG